MSSYIRFQHLLVSSKRPSLSLAADTASGGAVGFITYDAIAHFEPVTKPSSPLREPIAGLPEAYFMLTSTLVIFDHIFQTVKLVSHVHLPDGTPSTQVPALYEECVARIEGLKRKLESPNIPTPPQKPIKLGNEAVSNVGKTGYEAFVTKLKEHIVKGDIIQAVPSQRLARPTSLHPFNLFRQLRRLNPSPYMFYLNCGDVQVIGASPETLCKVEKRKVYNHAIAGTVRRGKTAEGELIHIRDRRKLTYAQRTSPLVKPCKRRTRIEQSTSCWSTWQETTSTESASPKRRMWTS